VLAGLLLDWYGGGFGVALEISVACFQQDMGFSLFD
jgi:hypothetical protein